MQYDLDLYMLHNSHISFHETSDKLCRLKSYGMDVQTDVDLPTYVTNTQRLKIREKRLNGLSLDGENFNKLESCY